MLFELYKIDVGSALLFPSTDTALFFVMPDCGFISFGLILVSIVSGYFFNIESISLCLGLLMSLVSLENNLGLSSVDFYLVLVLGTLLNGDNVSESLTDCRWPKFCTSITKLSDFFSGSVSN